MKNYIFLGRGLYSGEKPILPHLYPPLWVGVPPPTTYPSPHQAFWVCLCVPKIPARFTPPRLRQWSRLLYSSYRRQLGRVFLSPFVSVSVFPRDMSKIDAVMTTKHDKEMFHDKSWKPIYFGVKRSKSMSRVTANIAGVGLYTPGSAGFC